MLYPMSQKIILIKLAFVGLCEPGIVHREGLHQIVVGLVFGHVIGRHGFEKEGALVAKGCRQLGQKW